MAATASISALPKPAGRSAPASAAPGSLWTWFAPGQLLEISGTQPGKLSMAGRLVASAQADAEPAAWITLRDAPSFYPPDFAQAGVDLGALVVVRIPAAAACHGSVRAAELLLRSGAFGLVVVDLSSGVPKREHAWQARLSALARAHAARVVLITTSADQAPSLGPLIALRIAPAWKPRPAAERVVLSARVLKNKLGRSAELASDDALAPAGALRSLPCSPIEPCSPP